MDKIKTTPFQAAQVVLLEKRHTLDDREIRVSTAQRRGDGSVPQERMPADKFRQESSCLSVIFGRDTKAPTAVTQFSVTIWIE